MIQKKEKKQYFLWFGATVLFLSGCLFDKKKEQDENTNEKKIDSNFLFSVLSSVEKISQDDAKMLGFIFLPFGLEESLGKKNENFYVVDNFYTATIETFDSSYQLLKNLYIQDGWVLTDELFSNIYIHAFFKKQDKEMVVFIEEKEIYNSKTKEIKKQILLHQSLLLL